LPITKLASNLVQETFITNTTDNKYDIAENRADQSNVKILASVTFMQISCAEQSAVMIGARTLYGKKT